MVLFSGCLAPQTFITVTPRTDIPNGAREILIRESSADQIKQALNANSILYTTSENGLQTEDFLIDDCTRAKFVVTEYDGVIKVIPYWGITDKVRNQIQFSTIMATGMTNPYAPTDQMQRVIYKKTETRPKMVFDYALQVFAGTGMIQYK